MAAIVINRDRELLDAGVGTGGPMPAPLLRALEPQLAYVKMVRKPRGQWLDPTTGSRNPYEFRPVQMSAVDGRGRLVCQRGFAARVRRAAEAMGHAVEDRWVQYPQMRPGRFREDWDRLVRNFEFRPRQDEMVAAIAAAEGGLVVAPVGAGKGNIMAATALLYPDARIVVTTVSKDVAEQDHARISQYLPDVGMVGGGRNHVGRVTVYTAASLANKAASVDCDILLGDEAHELAAPSYGEAISIAGRYARRFGFTATPDGRSDRADPELEGLFGPRIFEMSYQEALDVGLVVPITVVWHDCVTDVNPAAGLKSDTARLRHGIWRHAARNNLIAGIARSYGEDDQVLIMVSTVEHALYLGAALPEYALCFSQIEAEEEQIWHMSGLVDSSRINRTDGERRRLRDGFARGEVKKVVATGVWSRGVSFDALSVLIAAGVQGKIAWTQTPGRVSRRHAASGKQVGVIHAIRDCFDGGFKASAAKMAAVFKSHGWAQVKAKDGAWKAVS